MLEWFQIYSSQNGGHVLDICENRFFIPYREYHLRWRIDQCSDCRRQPEAKLTLYWCYDYSRWILVTMVLLNQTFKKIDSWPPMKNIILGKEWPGLTSPGISQPLYQDCFEIWDISKLFESERSRFEIFDRGNTRTPSLHHTWVLNPSRSPFCLSVKSRRSKIKENASHHIKHLKIQKVGSRNIQLVI